MKKSKLGEVLSISSMSVIPQAGITYKLYSLPSFDDGQEPETAGSETIQSNKYVVPTRCILFNKLNVRFKRIWRINNNIPNKLCSTEFLPLVINEDLIDYQYCYYLLASDYLTNYLCGINSNTSGSHKRINPDILLSVDVALPTLNEQKRIGSMLANLDRKIEINRAINHNLEVMAKQLYDYWFVQFDFPDEEGKPYKSSGGKMKYCEELQMEMPDGWNVCRLSEFVSKNNTGDWGTDNPSENSIEIGCIRGADIIKLNNLPKRYINSSNRAKLLSVWDVVIEVSGGSPIQATGRSAFITSGVIERNGGKITCSNFCHAFSFKDYRESAYFFYIWKMFYDNGIMFNYEGKTSGIKNFMTETFLANKWVRAPKGLIYKFFDTIKSVYAKIDVNITESNDLIKQRDELLPLLMNGQATVNYDLSHD